MTIPFRKMHGLGNDFIVFDARSRPLEFAGTTVHKLADRHTGIGADTIVVIDNPRDDSADLFVVFYNSDGMQIGTCGNATRCVAKLFFAETGRDRVQIRTIDGVLTAWRDGENVAVDMGTPKLEWQQIPITHAVDTLHLSIEGALSDAVAVNIGNPHAVFFVPEAESVDLTIRGRPVELDPLFPQRTNVEFATIQSSDRIRMRVWERGVGITQACGSGACATLVAAVRRNLIPGRKATIALDGGDLLIEWRDDDHVIMTGPAALSFIGEIEEHLVTVPARQAAAA
jgi:diaminopimelate epimerase